MIDRFSEDIDITFNEHIGERRRKKLKSIVLKGISEELGMPVANWEKTQIRLLQVILLQMPYLMMM